MDIEEIDAIKELMSMTKDELDLVQFDLVKWVCACKNCNRYTKARDYGVESWYMHKGIKGFWFSTEITFYLCSTHYKFYNKLVKNHDTTKVQNKLLDYNKPKILKI